MVPLHKCTDRAQMVEFLRKYADLIEKCENVGHAFLAVEFDEAECCRAGAFFLTEDFENHSSVTRTNDLFDIGASVLSFVRKQPHEIEDFDEAVRFYVNGGGEVPATD